MKLLKTPEEEQEERKKVVDLKLITGGKEPPEGGESWIEKLDVGSCFLVRDKSSPLEFNLGLFRLAEKTTKAVVLQTPHVAHNLYVDPVRFCNRYMMYENLGVMINGSDRTEGDSTGETETLEGPAGE